MKVFSFEEVLPEEIEASVLLLCKEKHCSQFLERFRENSFKGEVFLCHPSSNSDRTQRATEISDM